MAGLCIFMIKYKRSKTESLKKVVGCSKERELPLGWTYLVY